MQARVYIIDDDASVRDALRTLVESVGLEARSFASADEFLDSDWQELMPGCVITDICLPGTTGIQLQQELLRRQIDWPIIAMSAHGDIPMAVEMLRRGAIDFIEKPFRNHLMLQRIDEALNRYQQQQEKRQAFEAVTARLQNLTPRERDVLPLLLSGESNKHVARLLSLSPRTVEIHRANILKKFEVRSVTELSGLLSVLNIEKNLPVPTHLNHC
jgi:two-component system response regulator FixJ